MPSTENIGLAATLMALGHEPTDKTFVRKPHIYRFFFNGLGEEEFEELRVDYLSSNLSVDPQTLLKKIRELKGWNPKDNES